MHPALGLAAGVVVAAGFRQAGNVLLALGGATGAAVRDWVLLALGWLTAGAVFVVVRRNTRATAAVPGDKDPAADDASERVVRRLIDVAASITALLWIVPLFLGRPVAVLVYAFLWWPVATYAVFLVLLGPAASIRTWRGR